MGPSRRDRTDAGSPWRLARLVVEWAPIWAPLALCVQIAFLGLRPALKEQRRLERESAALAERYQELVREHAELDRIRSAQRDPLYVERERRALLDPRTDPR
jgi:hypothetical protein